MAKTLMVPIPQGRTCTAKLLTIGTDTVIETIATLTEATNKKGWATGTIASASGWAAVVVFDGASNVGDFVVYVGSADPATYTAVDDAAIDWAKIQNPTTTVGLSGTTVKTATDVETDTADIQTRIPAALTAGGNIKADALAINESTEAANRLQRAARSITLGTVDTGATTTSIPTSSLSPAAAVTNQFLGLILAFDEATTTANLRGQKTDITASTAGGILTCTALTTAPVAGDQFSIE